MKPTRKLLPGAVVAAVLCAGAAQAGSEYVLLAHPEAIDGKSFTDDSGKLYRLHSIDAPEIDQQCIGADGQKYGCGEQSREALAKMIDGILTCDLVAGSEQPGVRTVQCYDFAGRDIGALLIAAGWALPDRAAGMDYVWDEMEAEARQRGLWQGRFIKPHRWRAGTRL